MEVKELFAFLMMISIVSFMGFWIENLFISVTKGYIDNRNMLFPFLLGYGLALAAIYVVFGTPSTFRFLSFNIPVKSIRIKRILYTLTVMLCICVGEIILGTAVEKMCGFHWWDFSGIPLHITRYTSIPTSFAYAVMISFFMEKVYLDLFDRLLTVNVTALGICSVTLTVLTVYDFFYSSLKFYKNKAPHDRWRIDTSETRLYRYLHR